jgi:hypothetical protein
VIAVLTVVCYWGALDRPAYLPDEDQLQFESWSVWDDPQGLLRMWSGEVHPDGLHYRPVANTIVWGAHQLWGENPVGYRLLNLTLHLLSVFLAIRVFRRIGLPAPEWIGFFIAFWPVVVQPVVWMVQTIQLVANFLFVAATWAFVRQHLQQSWRWGVLGLLFLALGLLAKITLVSFPLVLVMVGLMCRVRPTRQTWGFIAASFVITLALGWLDTHIVMANGGEVFDLTLRERLWWTLASTLQYLRNLLVPYPLALYYDLHVSALEWICGAGLAAAVIALLVTGKRQQAFRLLLVIAVCFVIVAPAMVGHNSWLFSPAEDRYQYLQPFVVVPYAAYLIAPLFRAHTPTRRWMIAGLGVLAVALILACMNQVATYDGPNRLFAVTARVAPRNNRWPLDYSMDLRRLGRYDEALKVLRFHSSEITTWAGDSQLLAQIAVNEIGNREYEAALQLMSPPRSWWTATMTAAILLEAPDPALRDDVKGAQLVASLATMKLKPPIPEHAVWRRVELNVLQASVHAAQGHFDQAKKLIEETRADPALEGRGHMRQLVRADLERRARSYADRVRYTSPESHLLWELYASL